MSPVTDCSIQEAIWGLVLIGTNIMWITVLRVFVSSQDKVNEHRDS